MNAGKHMVLDLGLKNRDIRIISAQRCLIGLSEEALLQNKPTDERLVYYLVEQVINLSNQTIEDYLAIVDYAKALP